MSGPSHPVAIEEFLASLVEAHTDLSARIRLVTHSAETKAKRVALHAHYLAFREGKPTVGEFVDILYLKLIPFCLHRKHINEAQQGWSKLPPSKVQESAIRLHQKALDLFKRANKNTNRNGEFGELIAFLLIESVLKAPQFVAKMSLKTSPQMPIHGSDGIHLSYDNVSGKLKLYWGESKCYASVQQAIDNAVESIAENLQHDKMSHELFLVDQYFDLAGFPSEFREAILSFLNPFDENYNKRADVSVMFISFDFAAFAALSNVNPDDVEKEFSASLCKALEDYASRLDTALIKHGVNNHSIEVFFLPVPSVDVMRSMFQDRIGWTP